jgi:hypothetical protein
MIDNDNNNNLMITKIIQIFFVKIKCLMMKKFSWIRVLIENPQQDNSDKNSRHSHESTSTNANAL